MIGNERIICRQWSTGAPAPAKITTPGPSQPGQNLAIRRPINLPPAKNHAFTGGTAGDFMNDFGTFLKKIKHNLMVIMRFQSGIYISSYTESGRSIIMSADSAYVSSTFELPILTSGRILELGDSQVSDTAGKFVCKTCNIVISNSY